MSYTIGLNPKKKDEDKEVNSIPCKLHYTGPAQVENYFLKETNGNELKGQLRGRGLNGINWKPPSGYEIVVLKERKGPKGKILDIECKKDSINVWEWDKSCGEDGKRTAIGRASDYLKMAQILAAD